MKESCQLYKQQIKKAKETIEILENKLHEVRLKLQQTNNSDYLKELRVLTLDMTITLNELEHSQSNFEQCMNENSKV